MFLPLNSSIERVMKSVYQMLKSNETERAEDIFKKMDLDSDGNITLEEFIDCCSKDAGLLTLLTPNLTEGKL